MTPTPHDFEPLDEDFNPDPDTLCPNCVADTIDPRSFFGWCRRCTGRAVAAHKAGRQQRWRASTAPQKASAT